jgi:iron-sulfur cluster repair protein YtfE (RIC family)
MSANAIAHRYPETEALFEQLQIDRSAEGYDTLEELALRHGMDVSQIIRQLRRAATKFQSV